MQVLEGSGNPRGCERRGGIWSVGTSVPPNADLIGSDLAYAAA